MIPDAAVEVAARFIWQGPLDVHREQVMRAALEAAAPHMLEGAYTDGYCDGMGGEAHNLDKYRPAK